MQMARVRFPDDALIIFHKSFGFLRLSGQFQLRAWKEFFRWAPLV